MVFVSTFSKHVMCVCACVWRVCVCVHIFQWLWPHPLYLKYYVLLLWYYCNKLGPDETLHIYLDAWCLCIYVIPVNCIISYTYIHTYTHTHTHIYLMWLTCVLCAVMTINLERNPDWPSINDYYTRKNIFLTGVTGFLGKCLVEKLLREIPDIGRIFVLVRPNRGKSAAERLKETFSSKVSVLILCVWGSYPSGKLMWEWIACL